MAFNVSVGGQNLVLNENKKYAIMIADTVLIKTNGTEVLTSNISKKYEDISYSLQV